MRALWLLLLVACRQSGAGVPAAAPAVTSAAAPAAALAAVPAASTPALRTGPPRGSIALIAVTDEGDAALTADTHDGLRLWPTLDGARPPVILPSRAAKQLALAHAGAGLVAGVLDEAGHLEVMRLTRDGAVVGSVQRAGDAGYDEVIAVPDGLLVLGRDQIVSRVDASGREVARLAPQPNERILELAARRGGAIAGIGSAGAVTSVRWIAFDGHLAWGAAVELATPLEGLALSPDHRRIAGIVADGGDGAVIELLPMPHVVASDLSIGGSPHMATIGFVDNLHVAVVGDFALRWAGAPSDQLVTWGAGSNSAQAVFGDGVVVVGRDDALSPVRWHQPVRFLGYHEVGIGGIRSAGAHVAMGLGFGMMWFDHHLGVTRVMEEADHEPLTYTHAIDDHLVVKAISPRRELAGMLSPETAELVPAMRASAAREPTRFVVRDVARNTEHALGAWPDVRLAYSGVSFDPTSRVMAITSGRMVERFVIDDRGIGTQLAALALHLEPETVVPIDPRRADGILAVAIAVARDRAQISIETVREAGAATVVAAATRLIGVDGRGTVWMLRGEREIIAYRDGVRIHQFAVGGPVDEGSVSRDGSFVVLYQWQANEVFLVEASGRDRWRRSLIQVETVQLTGDDGGVVVGTPGMLRELDAVTGDVLARGCAWDFGLHDKPSLNNATQCDESE